LEKPNIYFENSTDLACYLVIITIIIIIIIIIITIIIIIILSGREKSDMRSVTVIHEYAAHACPPLLQYSHMHALAARPYQFLQSPAGLYN